MKEIIITNKATIKGNGIHNGSAAKPVICIDTGVVYVSCTDAAKANNIHYTAMSQCCLGKVKRVKGKRYCYLSNVHEHLDEMTAQIRKLSEMEIKAAMWDAMIAEQEAARKAEEERINAERKAKEELTAKIIKTEEKLARRKAIYEHKLAEAKAADERVAQTEQELYELYALLGNKANEKEVEVA